jgi:hypothetical protein
MNDDPLPPKGIDVWIEPLTSKMPNGSLCRRPEFVDAALAEALKMTQAERLVNLPRWPSEAISYFVMRCPRTDEQAFAEMLQELVKRGIRTARRELRGLDRAVARDILEDVEYRLLELLLSKEPSYKREFLEMSFAKAVELYTLNRIRDYLRSPLGGRADFTKQEDEDGDAIDLLELLPSGGPGPEYALLRLEDTKERHRLLRVACQAVEDRRILKALILHHGYGWPIESNDPKVSTLVRHFQIGERQIRRWLTEGMRAMRQALSVPADPKGEGK